MLACNIAISYQLTTENHNLVTTAITVCPLILSHFQHLVFTYSIVHLFISLFYNLLQTSLFETYLKNEMVVIIIQSGIFENWHWLLVNLSRLQTKINTTNGLGPFYYIITFHNNISQQYYIVGMIIWQFLTTAYRIITMSFSLWYMNCS